MFRPKKTDESQYISNLTISNFNDTCNGASKVTSTPLHTAFSNTNKNSVVHTPPKKHISTRRYSLSEISSTNKSLLGNKSQWQGPLLASLNYKDNISMYEETKSSGLVNRVVSYNQEAEGLPEPTHQEKYNSPGLFPIVHLFKKKTPILEHSNKVKIRLSNSVENLNHIPVRRNSVDETRLSFRKKHHLSSNNQNVNESGTKSVLDALKEISRKRIHSSEDVDSGNEESGKRIRTEISNGPSSHNKRVRENSPYVHQEVSPKQIQKKLCVYDEYAASKSSTDFSFLKKMDTEPKSTKRKTMSTSTETCIESKKKLVSVETQTVVATVEDAKENTTTVENDDTSLKKSDNTVKVFRHTPLDKIRKTRLTALMGNLARTEAAIKNCENKKDDTKLIQEQKAEKPSLFGTNKPKDTVSTDVVNNQERNSIITSSKTDKDSETVKSDKHVHFNLSNTVKPPSADAVTSSVSVAASNLLPSMIGTTSANTPTFNAISTSAPTFSFGQSSAVANTSNSTIKESANNIMSSSNSSKPSGTVNKQPAVSPVKGGFKFDLKMPVNNSASSSISTTSAPNMTISSTASLVTSSIASSTAGGVTFSLGNNTTKLTPIVPDPKLSSSSFSFGKPPEEKALSPPQKTSFTIPTTTEGNNIGNATFSFNNKSPPSFASNPPSTAISSSSTTPNFSFSTQILSASTSTSSTTTTTPSLSFNNPVLKSTTFNFSSMSNTAEPAKTAVSTSSSFTFGLGMGNNNGPAAGVVPSTAPLTFGSVTTTASSGFGSNTVSLNLTTKPTFKISGGEGFSKTTTQTVPSTTSVASTTFSFGGGATASSKPFSFGSSATTTPTSSIFGSLQTTAVSKENNPSKPTPSFGVPNAGFKTTTTTAGSTFGSGPTPSTAIFGSASTTSAPMFGTSTTSSTPIFGSAVATSVFGTSTSSTFGSPAATSAPSFGADKKKPVPFGSGNVFGNANNAPSFGSVATPTFGSPAKPLFGASSNPSSSNTVVPTFGSSIGSTFGTTTSSSSFTTTTTAAPSFNFGSSGTFTFGGGVDTKASSGFGSGTSTSGFGKPTATPNNQTQFGSNDKGFNTTFNSTTFGNNTPSFGATATTFGTTSNNAFGGQTQPQSSSFNFNATPAPSGSFMAADSSKPTFNFTGAAPTQSFGSNASTNAFNSTFNAAVPTFGASGTPSAGVFNIGSGSTSNRPRAQARAKRRT